MQNSKILENMLWKIILNDFNVINKFLDEGKDTLVTDLFKNSGKNFTLWLGKGFFNRLKWWLNDVAMQISSSTI